MRMALRRAASCTPTRVRSSLLLTLSTLHLLSAMCWAGARYEGSAYAHAPWLACRAMPPTTTKATYSGVDDWLAVDPANSHARDGLLKRDICAHGRARG